MKMSHFLDIHAQGGAASPLERVDAPWSIREYPCRRLLCPHFMRSTDANVLEQKLRYHESQSAPASPTTGMALACLPWLTVY